MMGNDLVSQLFKQINNTVEIRMDELTSIKSAMVDSVNSDNTVNIHIPPSNTIFHNIQNQSVYQKLVPGDHVKIMVEGNNLSNMWIIGKFNATSIVNENIRSGDLEQTKGTSSSSNNSENSVYSIDQSEFEDLDANLSDELIKLSAKFTELNDKITALENAKDDIFDSIYPVGSIYISTESEQDFDPNDKFTGVWEKIDDAFLMSAGGSMMAASGRTFELGKIGGNEKGGYVTLQTENIPNIEWSYQYRTLEKSSTGDNTEYFYLTNEGSASGRLALSTKTMQVDGVAGNYSPEEIDILPPYYVVNIWRRTG